MGLRPCMGFLHATACSRDHRVLGVRWCVRARLPSPAALRERARAEGALAAVQRVRARFTVTGARAASVGEVSKRNRARLRRLADSAAARLGEQKDYAYLDDEDVVAGPQGAFMRETMAALDRMK